MENTRVHDKAEWRSGRMHVMRYGNVFFGYVDNKIIRSSDNVAAKFTDIFWAVQACEFLANEFQVAA